MTISPMTIDSVNTVFVAGFTLLNAQRDNLLLQIGGIQQTLFAARSLLPLRYTVAVFGDEAISIDQAEGLFTKPALGFAEGKKTDRSHRRAVSRIAALHNAWVGKTAGFAGKKAKAGVAAIDKWLSGSAKPKFAAEAKAALDAFSVMSFKLPGSYFVAESDDKGDELFRPVVSSETLDAFLGRAGSANKAQKAVVGKTAKQQAAKDASVKTESQPKGGVQPKAVVEANKATKAADDVEPKAPGGVLEWNALLGTLKASVDAMLNDATLPMAEKHKRFQALTAISFAAMKASKPVEVQPEAPKAPPVTLAQGTAAAAKADADAGKTEAKPRQTKAQKAAAKLAADIAKGGQELAKALGKQPKAATVETVVVDEKPGDSPAETAKANEAEAVAIQAAKPKRQAKAAKPLPVVGSLGDAILAAKAAGKAAKAGKLNGAARH